jgi:predicted ABC-type ATPase
MWRSVLADRLEMPLINADRMMLSILPEPGEDRQLVAWAARLRDQDPGWMRVAQQGVQAFVGHAMAEQVPFAMETVFSYWEERPDGRVASKIDLITNLQAAGYFVLLAFVGLRGRLDQSRGDAGAGGWARRPGRDPAAAVSQDANGDCRGAEGCGRLDPGRQPPDAG